MQNCMSMIFLCCLAACAANPTQQLAETPPSANVARTALSDGAPEVALNVSTGLLKARPDDPETLLIQGDAFAQLGRRQEAEEVYRKVFARDPGSVTATMRLGRLLLASDASGAEALFAQAANRQPRDAAALNDLGIARDLQGRHGDAQIAYRQALAAAPDLSAATANLALSLSLSGHAAEGMELLKPLADAPSPQPRLRYDLAAVATLAGQRQSAEVLLKNDLTSEKLQAALDGFSALAPQSP